MTDADAAYGSGTAAAADGTVGGAAEPAVQETDPETGLTQVAAPTVGVQVTGAGAVLLEDPSGRGLAGQEIFAADAELAPLGSGGSGPERTDPTDPSDPTERTATARTLMGQDLWPAREGDAGQPAALDEASTLVTDPDARSLAGQAIFAAGEIEPLHEPRPVPAAATTDAGGTTAGAGSTDVTGTGTGGSEIGEEHPDVGESDAIFEAREALELGALALTIGRLSTTQLAGYRLLAEATVPYVQGDRFVDAAAYTETNAAFHDYLFTLTGNEHLLQAYQRLGVRGHMDQTLRNATWCDPRCAQDHLDIVTAFEGGDRDAARTLISEHAARSNETTRRAMREQAATRRPAFVTPGRFAGQVVVVTGAAQGIGEAVARRIHAEGGALVLADRSELVQELADELGGDTPAEAVVTDLETYSGARSVVDHAVARHGRVDVAIHNVGGAIWFKPFQEFTPEQIDAEIARSLMTTLYGCRAVLEPMVEAGRGTIPARGRVHRRDRHRHPRRRRTRARPPGRDPARPPHRPPPAAGRPRRGLGRAGHGRRRHRRPPARGRLRPPGRRGLRPHRDVGPGVAGVSAVRRRAVGRRHTARGARELAGGHHPAEARRAPAPLDRRAGQRPDGALGGRRPARPARRLPGRRLPGHADPRRAGPRAGLRGARRRSSGVR